jgi:hypothetical protein
MQTSQPRTHGEELRRAPAALLSPPPVRVIAALPHVCARARHGSAGSGPPRSQGSNRFSYNSPADRGPVTILRCFGSSTAEAPPLGSAGFHPALPTSPLPPRSPPAARWDAQPFDLRLPVPTATTSFPPSATCARPGGGNRPTHWHHLTQGGGWAQARPPIGCRGPHWCRSHCAFSHRRRQTCAL